MKALDVMTRRIVSVHQGATILEAAQLMLQDGISGLPVVDNAGRLMGIVTEKDLLRRAETGTERHRTRWLDLFVGPGRLADEYVHTHGRKVEEVMTREVVTVTEDTTLDAVVSLMEEHRIKRLPVARGEQVVGIVTRADLLRALVSLARDEAPAAADDASIQLRVQKELEGQPWAPRVKVVVRKGIVDLWGTILDERQRQALRVAAENVPGVKVVRDHLVYVEPFSGMVINTSEDDPAGEAHSSRRVDLDRS